MYEKGFSAHSGAENLIAANYLYATLDKNYIPTDIFKEKKTLGKLGNMAFRLTKYWFLDNQLSNWGKLTQHEYFGHTVRANQAGFLDAYPVIGIPYIPHESPKTYLGKAYRDYSIIQRNLIYAGGVESNVILAQKIFKNALLENEILYNQGIFYITNNNALNYPIVTMDNIDIFTDINEYNERTQYIENKEKVNSQFKTLAWLDILIDPMNYIAIYSIFKNYIYEGKHRTKIPMLRIGKKIRYLPDFRYVLAPYSPELMYENYFRFDDKLLNVTIRHAALTSHKSFGITATLYNYGISRRFSFDSQISYWDQPEIKIYNDANEKTTFDENGLGLAFIQSTYYKIVNKNDFSLMIAVGYKTGGYLEGEILDEGPILRGGLSFRFEE